MSILHQIALTRVDGVGVVTARILLDHFGSAEHIFSASEADLKAVNGLRKPAIDAILRNEALGPARQELQFIEKYKINTLFYSDSNYPQRLKNCYDAPILLYYRGKADLNSKRVISIVGTRNATAYGKELCNELVEGLARHQALVISGLALGIDGLAHQACLKHGVPTVGILGHGLDRIYPLQHRTIAEKMLNLGGLLTEFPSGTRPDRENFPKRNRIIAGLADATIIVEANIKGGALITAEIANSYNRDVFAYPGNVHNEFSAGCNYLIKTNRAHLVSGIKDIEYLLGWDEVPVPREKQISLKLNLSAEEKRITDLLQSRHQAAIDEIAIQTGLAQSKLAMTMLGLEMQGIVIALPGKVYKLA